MKKDANAALLDFLVTQPDVQTFFLQKSALKQEFYPLRERNNFGNLRTTLWFHKKFMKCAHILKILACLLLYSVISTTVSVSGNMC